MPRRLFSLIGLFLLATVLRAQPLSWNRVHTPAGARFSLQYRIYQAGPNWVVEFRNTGAQKVHFNYRFPSLQSKQEAVDNGRIHLNAVKGRGQMPLPSFGTRAPAAVANLPLQVFNVRVAVTDHGDLETETD